LLADLSEEALDRAAKQLSGATVVTVPTDVSQLDDVQRLKDRAYAAFGEVAVLMNNAGVSAGGGPFDHYQGWQRVLSVNLWGVINGVHTFAQAMIDQGTPAAIVNTGSKQGITCPPGNTAYNVTKAGVKVLTEGLAHTLRNIAGCQVSAHLLVPGSAFTGMTAGGRTEKPAGSWMPEQVVDFMAGAMAAGDFYIICPNNVM
jgi:NAD(P)-dependent dehydrogenase (short-subunit alcohol dehydrogenase family)